MWHFHFRTLPKFFKKFSYPTKKWVEIFVPYLLIDKFQYRDFFLDCTLLFAVHTPSPMLILLIYFPYFQELQNNNKEQDKSSNLECLNSMVVHKHFYCKKQTQTEEALKWMKSEVNNLSQYAIDFEDKGYDCLQNLLQLNSDMISSIWATVALILYSSFHRDHIWVELQ